MEVRRSQRDSGACGCPDFHRNERLPWNLPALEMTSDLAIEVCGAQLSKTAKAGAASVVVFPINSGARVGELPDICVIQGFPKTGNRSGYQTHRAKLSLTAPRFPTTLMCSKDIRRLRGRCFAGPAWAVTAPWGAKPRKSSILGVLWCIYLSELERYFLNNLFVISGLSRVIGLGHGSWAQGKKAKARNFIRRRDKEHAL